jgi:hypothetical protein
LGGCFSIVQTSAAKVWQNDWHFGPPDFNMSLGIEYRFPTLAVMIAT